MNIPPISDLNILVPSEVLDAFISLYDRCVIEKLPRATNESFLYQTYYVQAVPEKFSHIKNPENYKIETEWLFDTVSTNIIKRFLESHFSSYFGLKIVNLKPNHPVKDYNRHAFPRVFIPLRGQAKYTSYVDKPYTMTFSVGSCYLWDVRHFHEVINNNTVDRLAAIISIDPNTETLLTI